MVLLILLGLVYYLISYNNQTGSAADLSDREFAIENTEDIGKIFIAHRDRESITLTKKGSEWYVNDGMLASENAMENLLRVIKDLEIKYIPTRASYSNVIQTIAGIGIKVEIYDRRDRLMKAYYIGGVSQDERGTYFIMEDADQPYVMHLPYWKGSLRTRFQLRENDWRDRAIFSESPSDIEQIKVFYPNQVDESFVVQKDGNQFNLLPYNSDMPKITRTRHPGLLESYVRNYGRIAVESFQNDLPGRDSVMATTPFCTIEVNRTDGEVKSFNFYHRTNRFLPGPLAARQASGEEFTLRFFVNGKNEDFMSAQYNLLKEIFWGYSWFFRSQEESYD